MRIWDCGSGIWKETGSCVQTMFGNTPCPAIHPVRRRRHSKFERASPCLDEALKSQTIELQLLASCGTCVLILFTNPLKSYGSTSVNCTAIISAVNTGSEHESSGWLSGSVVKKLSDPTVYRVGVAFSVYGAVELLVDGDRDEFSFRDLCDVGIAAGRTLHF